MQYARYLDLELSGWESLPGEVHDNYRLTGPEGVRYLLKVSTPDPDALAFQTALLDHLGRQALPFAVPRLLDARTVTVAGNPRQLCRYTYLSGRLLATVKPRTPALFRSWGASCGHLCRALGDFDHPYAHRQYRWDPQRAFREPLNTSHLLQNEKILAEYFVSRFRHHDLSGLRHSVNYNDAHEHNLLVGPDHTISGVIDFDDAVYTATVCELAIAAAYAGMGAKDPLGVWRELVAGFHSVFPLREEEVAVLYDLIAARLLLTLTTAAQNRHDHPDNSYLTISERGAKGLLRQLHALHPDLARAHFRAAAGLTPHPAQLAFTHWANTALPEPLMQFTGQNLIPLDLGVGSTVLGGNASFTSPLAFTTRVRRHLTDQAAGMAVGGYGETRPVYTTDDFQSEGNQGPRWRTVHLGLDFWTPAADTPVVCPVDGTVQAYGQDPTAGGYGNTIILRHEPTPDLTFYTLYGHLSACSLAGLRAGSQVEAGQLLATVGGQEENGGWPPHLHFQVLLDLLGKDLDYPGVAYPEEAAVWLGICPDPRSLIPYPLPEEAPRPILPSALLERRRRVLGRSLSVSYGQQPLQILRGAGQYLYDHTGRRYLDTVNNVAHVGHEHPRVVAAARRQLSVLNTNSRYLHPAIVTLAERLVATLPAPLSVVHFVNSGSEANELALRMAEAYTGSRDMLALEMGYHGNTTRTIEVSQYKFDRKGGRGRPACTALLAPTLAEPDLPDHRASFIHESILSCAGQLPLPPGYLDRVYRHVRQQGGICIADEVQTGLGRVGTHYWAFEQQGVVPDVVTLGKPFGNGHPLGAVVCTPAVAEAFANGMEYFNTFGGNPVSCAVGLAVLEAVRDEGLQQHALAIGDYLKALFGELQSVYPIIADVRGSGLFLGVELLGKDASPAAPPAAYVMHRMRELGFLMSTDGPYENVLKVKPPLCFSRDNAEMLADYLGRTLGEDHAQI